MIKYRLLLRTARNLSRGGFTLVELLVVIGIIAILAGVALGPITRGLQKGAQSAGVQTSRTIAIAEFQYAGDNNNNYPDLSSGKAVNIAQILMGSGGGAVYISDPSTFTINGASEKKYTGSSPASGIANANISWDFGGNSGGGLNPNTSDLMPVVWSSVSATATPTLTGSGPITVSLYASAPFGTSGVAVTYHSNSAKFITQPSGAPNLCDPSFPANASNSVLPGNG